MSETQKVCINVSKSNGSQGANAQTPAARLNPAHPSQTPAARPIPDYRSATATVAEAAEKIGVCRATIYKLIKNKELTAKRIGKGYRISLASIYKYLHL